MSEREPHDDIGALLDHGIRCHTEGDLAAAAAAYEQVLAAQPENGDALSMLGVVALQSGQADKAVEILSEAVRVDDGHPGYHNNLGQALDAMDDVAGALDHYRKALALAPGDPRCLNNIGLALSRMGELADALEVATAAVEADPGNAEYRHNLGAILLDMGRLEDAETAFQQALELNPDQAVTYASLGLVLAERGDVQEAVECCLEATALDPFYTDGHEACRKLLWDSGHADEMNISYRLACEQLPDSSEAFLNLGSACLEALQMEEAVPALEQALSLDPANAAAHSKLGTALAGLGRHDESIDAHRKAVELDDGVAAYHEALGDAHADRSDFGSAAEAYFAAYQRNPRRSSILGSLTIALNETADPDVDQLVDYDRYVTTRMIEPPSGFESIEAFNDALHEELEVQHVPRPYPIGQTMRGGTQNKGHLFRGATGLVRVVQDRISDALRDYIRSLERDQNHPFLRYANENIRFTGAWSTILSESGYDESHIHNDGWISGVYYVQTPEIDEARWEEGEGCIQFGRPPAAFASERNAARRRIRPRSGMAVFFPSYYWHGVEPFHQKGLRHSIAFDVL